MAGSEVGFWIEAPGRLDETSGRDGDRIYLGVEE
jgi:hypothetical protein